MYVLGIDGGGTKTIGLLCDRNGKIHAQTVVGPTNPNSLGYEAVEQEIKKLLDDLKTVTPEKFNQITNFFAGMSGVDRDADKERMTQLYAKFLPTTCQIAVDNDAVNALYSGTYGKPGVVNISGTGAITFGMKDANNRARVGGWGFLLGDPGSGYSIGNRAVKAVFDEYDGFGKRTLLTDSISHHLGLNNIPELIPIIYDMKKSRETLASLSKLVVEAAEQGDVVAREILHQAGIEMGEAIRNLIEKLYKGDTENEIPVVLAGGVYHNAEWYIPTIESILQTYHLKTKVILPELPPVAGSVIAAILQSGAEIQENFTRHFLKEE